MINRPALIRCEIFCRAIVGEWSSCLTSYALPGCKLQFFAHTPSKGPLSVSQIEWAVPCKVHNCESLVRQKSSSSWRTINFGRGPSRLPFICSWFRIVSSLVFLRQIISLFYFPNRVSVRISDSETFRVFAVRVSFRRLICCNFIHLLIWNPHSECWSGACWHSRRVLAYKVLPFRTIRVSLKRFRTLVMWQYATLQACTFVTLYNRMI